MKAMKLTLSVAFVFTLALGVVRAQETADAPQWTPVYEGVDVACYERTEPLMKILAARVDLKASGVEFKTSAPNADFELEKRETTRETTATFLKNNELAVAVNANFYQPFNASTISTPGDANILGLGVSDGFVESKPLKGYPSFVVKNNGDVEIRQYDADEDLSDVRQAVSGNKIVLQDDVVVTQTNKDVHPRTAVGYSKDKRYVYFLVIDGRQKNFSVGATYEQVGEELKYLGASVGLNLDGGGSTTFVLRDSDNEPVVVNRPCNNTSDKLRFNANAIGVKAKGEPKAPPVGFRF